MYLVSIKLKLLYKFHLYTHFTYYCINLFQDKTFSELGNQNRIQERVHFSKYNATILLQ